MPGSERVLKLKEELPEIARSAALRQLGATAANIEPTIDENRSYLGLKDPRYNRLAYQVLGALIEIHPDMEIMTVEVGCLEMTELLRKCSDTYANYCEDRGIQPSIEELREMLHASTGILDKFMGMSNGPWKTFSTSFDSQGKYGQPAYPECVIEVRIPEDQSATAFFSPNELGWRSAMMEALSLGKPVDPNGKQVCPARGLFANTAWKQVADMMCDDPTLFAADLGIEPV